MSGSPERPLSPSEAEDPLIMGVPKKGRLYDKCVELLNGAGIEYDRPSRVDIAMCTNLNVKLVFLPSHDIAKYVGDGDVDLGILGQDTVAETKLDVKEVMKLGFGKCRLCVQAPIKSHITDVKTLVGKRVATSFPNIASDYFAQFGEGTKFQYVSGSVEAACGLGLSDCVVDLVETGTTMRAAGLEIIAEVMKSEAVLVANPRSRHPQLLDRIVKRIQGYQTAQKYCLLQYNIQRDLLPVAERITPGFTAPTVQPLEDQAWVAVNAMVPKSEVSNKMDELQSLGAQAILMFTMANCRV